MSYHDRDSDIENDADKRAHHNELERKRRDHIKDSFAQLRDALPYFQKKKGRANSKQKASRAQILRKAIKYLDIDKRKEEAKWKAVQREYNRQMKVLDDAIQKLEAYKSPENLALAADVTKQAKQALVFFNSYGDQPEHAEGSDSDESS